MRPVRDEAGNVETGPDGRARMERTPGSPTRPATARDANCWWEDADGEVPEGAIVREV
jgi:hypothetical protein